MNILIVGNGFDLSHYLPTKYDHFMDVMAAIESSKNDSLDFDDLFSKCREKEFIRKTKEYYLTENIQVESEKIKEIRNLLNENCWYQYFKSHVQEIKTWIDFEQKIESVLNLLSRCFLMIDQYYEKYGSLESAFKLIEKNNLDKRENFLYVSEVDFQILINIGMVKNNPKYGIVGYFDTGLGVIPNKDDEKGFIQEKWFNVQNNSKYGFSKEKYLAFLIDELEKFSELFNLYLYSIVSKLQPSSMFTIKSKDRISLDKIFSFNYTNTYQRLYKSVDVEYLHGSHGDLQNKNIVLGISDIEGEALKKLKAYGFTKYHQKILKNTQYIFLYDLKEQIKNLRKNIDVTRKSFLEDDWKSEAMRESDRKYIRINERKLEKLKGKIYIWGHSLDISDKNYINELFDINEYEKVFEIIIFYHNKQANFELLANLIHILGKEKVEFWMKNKWLKFEENPKIDFGVQVAVESE